MNADSERPAGVKSAAEFLLPGSKAPYTEAEIIERCRTGELSRGATYSVKGPLLGGSLHQLDTHPPFDAALREFEARETQRAAVGEGRLAVMQRDREETERRRTAAEKLQEAQTNPAPRAVLLVRDGEAKGAFTVGQLKYKFSVGEFSANSEFKHPDYEEWFPCLGLFRQGTQSKPDDLLFESTAALLMKGGTDISSFAAFAPKILEQLTLVRQELTRAADYSRKIKNGIFTLTVVAMLLWLFGIGISEHGHW